MKNYLKTTLLLVVVSISVFYWNSVRNSPQQSNDLFLQNVEALANNESKPMVSCYGTGSVDCPNSGNKVKRVTENYSLW